jgi:aerobic carbon-monoxide dehydrogenase medium subunit
MYAFNYIRPKSLDEASRALQAERGAKLLAGGQTLLPTIKLRLNRVPALIDLGAIAGLNGIEKQGNALIIGAMATHAEIATSPVVASAIPGLSRLAETIGDPQVRNLGTIGGSLANNDPAADYPAAALALGATLKTTKRSVTADEHFRGLFATFGEDEILTGIAFPIPKRFAYAKFPNPASRFALVGVAVADTASGVRVAVTGAGSAGVFRAGALEAALGKSFAPAAVKDVRVDASNLTSDIHADAEYRAHLIKVMAARAVKACLG